jgi:hypothetical protein
MKAVAGEQGLITEAYYKEQAASYANIAAAAGMAADAEDKAATGDTITGIIKGVAGVATLLAAPATGRRHLMRPNSCSIWYRQLAIDPAANRWRLLGPRH